MTEDRHCGACRSPAVPADTFCTRCGTQLPAAAPPAPASTPVRPAAEPSGERVIAVIGGLTLVEGFMGLKQKAYTLIITERRLIFSEVNKERAKAIIDAARDGAKAEGKGFFGQWGAQMKSSTSYNDVYWQMSPDAALAETPGNWAVERSQYQGAKFRTSMADENNSTPDVLIIKAATGKWKFHVLGSLSSVKKKFKEVGLA
ncbi:MAG: hypothetical protein Q7W51_10450 [Coriobacteriia bacterium]|nr:hypothetical protein [Coriobacteriia bacterium]